MWVDFEDTKPEENQEVLFTHIGIKDFDGTLMKPMVSSGFYQKGYFFSWVGSENRRDECGDRMKSTHWMPMPEPPTKADLRNEKIETLTK